MIGLIVKVLVLSLALSIAIKYGASVLPLTPTTTIVLVAVWSPAAIMAAVLSWRWRQE